MLGAFAVLVAVLLADPLPQKGPIYDLLTAYHAENPQTPEDEMRWANDFVTALRANPEEEWSTRINAYEAAGGILWGNDDYGRAASVFLDQLDESARREDSGESVRALDSLINLYQDADFPVQDVLDFYDATEAWLQEPPPGAEEQYAKLLHDLYGEQASRLEMYAQTKASNDQERQAWLQQAEYFRKLAEGSTPVQHETHVTLGDIAAKWFEKNKLADASGTEGEATAQSPTRPPVTTPPLQPQAAPTPAFKESSVPATPPVEGTERTAPKEAEESDASSGVVILACLGIIIVSWGGGAYFYMKRR